MRKPRSLCGLQEKLARLSGEDRALFDRMLPQLTYQEMVRTAAERFGIHTSVSALGAYYRRHVSTISISEQGDGSQLQVGGFELTITCPRQGVVNIVAKPLPPSGEAVTKEPPHKLDT